jgi:hypothetical protein
MPGCGPHAGRHRRQVRADPPLPRGGPAQHGERGRPITPEKFAKRAIRAVLRGDVIIVIPAWWKAWWYLERLSPTLSMRFAKIVMLKPMRAIEADAS